MAANGHPEERRVSFPEMDAIAASTSTSTAGQKWMWTRSTVSIPPESGVAPDREDFSAKPRCKATEGRCEGLAERSWKGFTHEEGCTTFSATPSVDIAAGRRRVEFVVRYVKSGRGAPGDAKPVVGIVVKLMQGSAQKQARQGRRAEYEKINTLLIDRPDIFLQGFHQCIQTFLRITGKIAQRVSVTHGARIKSGCQNNGYLSRY